MVESTEQAIEILRDTDLSELEREHAIAYLHDHPTPEAIDALIEGLEDDDPGVRWKSATALARQGESAMHPLLIALCQPDADARLREGAWHVLRQNSSSEVRAESQELLQALRGPSANIATLEAANKLLLIYR